MITLDTETCGLHGPIVLLQYAIDDGPVQMYSPFNESISDTLELIEMIVNHPGGIVGFNLAFDWFHICQTYTTLLELGALLSGSAYPIDHINEYADCEPLGRDGPCLKPVTACDLMLHARKGPYQSTMDRRNIRIKRIPTALAGVLATELESRIKLKDIYFARKKIKTEKKWVVEDIVDNPEFKNLVLRFAPSSALKVLAIDALGLEPESTLLYKDIEVNPRYRPLERGWAPFALAVSNKDNYWKAQFKSGSTLRKGYAWPGVIEIHNSHWAYNELARKYAAKDVTLTRDLYNHFGRPTLGDNDSILACMVASVRWHGFKINESGIRTLRDTAIAVSQAAPKAPKKVYQYVTEVMSETERIGDISGSTKKVVLEEIAKWTIGNSQHPAAIRAQACLDARTSQKEIEVYDKLLQAGRFHASFKVIGTKSSRMSGTDGLNPQGIKRSTSVRRQFPLASGQLHLIGGDFESFEVCIADAIYADPNLRKQLLTCYRCGYEFSIAEYTKTNTCPVCRTNDARKKIHGLFGQELTDWTYEDVLKTKGNKTEDWYEKGKRGVFSQMYGGNFQTMINKLGVDEEKARQAEQSWLHKFPGIKRVREEISEQFAALRQPQGIGSQVDWHEPNEYVETVNGFRRYFTLEFQICKILYTLGNKVPPAWKSIKVKCVRRERVQQAYGAVMSALFAAAFNIQSQVMRAAGNHVIQSTGAIITKELQTRLWTLQPIGIHDWAIQPMNVHDEIMAPCLSDLRIKVRGIVDKLILDMQSIVPLIKIDWHDTMETWAEK